MLGVEPPASGTWSQNSTTRPPRQVRLKGVKACVQQSMSNHVKFGSEQWIWPIFKKGRWVSYSGKFYFQKPRMLHTCINVRQIPSWCRGVVSWTSSVTQGCVGQRILVGVFTPLFIISIIRQSYNTQQDFFFLKFLLDRGPFCGGTGTLCFGL